MRFRAAAIQFEPHPVDKLSNRERMAKLVEQAAQGGARLIVTPETGFTGCCWYNREEALAVAETLPGSTTEQWEKIARRYGCCIVSGIIEQDASGLCYNSAFLVDPQGLRGVYRKNHLFISDHKWAVEGNKGFPVWRTAVGTLGIAICADLEFPETVRVLRRQGAEIICCPTAWLGEKCPAATWITRAWENGVYLIAADRWGEERGIQFSGGSCIIGPQGEILAYRDAGDGIVAAEVCVEGDNSAVGVKEGIIPVSDRGINQDRGREYDLLGLPDDYSFYYSLALHTYRWPPGRFFGLYGYQPLPAGKETDVAVVQMEIPPGGLKAATAEIIKAVREWVMYCCHQFSEPSSEPGIVVFPDLSGFMGTGGDFAGPPGAHAVLLQGPEIREIGRIAEENRVYLVWGVLEEAEDHFYKTVVLWGPEGCVGYYRQVHLPPAALAAGLTRGNNSELFFDLPSVRLGLLGGYELCYPEAVRVLALQGVDLVAVAGDIWTPFPRRLGATTIPHPRRVPVGDDPFHWCPGRVRSWENGCYVAVANSALKEGVFCSSGYGSGVFDPVAYRRIAPQQELLPFAHPGFLVRRISTALSSPEGKEVRSKEVLRRRLPHLYVPLFKG